MNSLLIRQDYRPKRLLLLWIISIILAIWMFPSFYFQTFASGLGGYISEKLVDRSGVSDSSLIVGTASELVTASSSDIGLAPVIATLPSRTVGNNPVQADIKFQGRINDMNGFPSASIWFEWGYNTGYGNTTTTQTVTSSGTYTATISNITKPGSIHFRFCASTDGTSYGDDRTVSHSTTGIIAWFIPVVFALIGIVLLFKFRGNLIAILIGGVLIALGTVILANLTGALW